MNPPTSFPKLSLPVVVQTLQQLGIPITAADLKDPQVIFAMRFLPQPLTVRTIYENFAERLMGINVNGFHQVCLPFPY